MTDQSVATGMRNHNEDSRARRRSEIVRAAVDVFAERGYFAARMREVAERAGVADGTLYLYFKGKEDLLVSILEEYAEAFLLRARQDCAGLEDPRDKLRRIVERHLVSMQNDRALAHIFQIELRHTRRFLRRVARGKVAEYLNLLQEIVKEGRGVGVFRRDVPPELAARAIFGALDEQVTAWVLARRPTDLRDQIDPLIRILLAGLAPPNYEEERNG